MAHRLETKRFPIQRLAQVLALAVAGLLTVATSAGEANDDESNPGGSDPGGEQNIGEEEVDFTEVETPTEVVVGGSDFLLTGDGRYVVALRSVWFGGGDVEPYVRSRKLFALDTQTGAVTSGVDLRDSGDFGVVLLDDPGRIVVVHRDTAGNVERLEGVRLPDFTVQWSHTPSQTANAVRLSPSGRYFALWQVNEWGWFADEVDHLTVTIHDRQSGQSTSFSGVEALADVVAEPDSSAFHIAISQRDYDVLEHSTLRLVRVELTAGLPHAEQTIGAAGHASDLEIKGGSSLRLNPESRTLVFAGCTFWPGTCNARMYVLDADTLQRRGDLRGAGAAVFDPLSDRALGWDGASSDEGKIWITHCQTAGSDPTDPAYVDHWLLSFDTETLDSSAVELPGLAPYYFMTRDGAHVVVSTENCGAHQLYAVPTATGEATPIAYADHALHHFTVLEDHHTIFSVDRGVLERIDLHTLSAQPTGLGQYVSRINRLPGGNQLVLADPDLLTFYLYDAETDTLMSTQSIDGAVAPPPPLPGVTPPARAPVPRIRLPRARVPTPLRAERHAPRRALPRRAGQRLGEERRL